MTATAGRSQGAQPFKPRVSGQAEGGGARGLYTYVVTPAGPSVSVRDASGRDELHFLATLARRDGGAIQRTLVIRATEAQPDLVALTEAAVATRRPFRMVVRFERTSLVMDEIDRIRTIAVADAILGAKRAETSRDGQLDLFA